MMHTVCWSVVTDDLKDRAAFFFSPRMEILLLSSSCDDATCVVALSRGESISRGPTRPPLPVLPNLSLSVCLSFYKPQHKPEFGFFFVFVLMLPAFLISFLT